MKIERFEDLEIWKEARSLSKVVFEITGIKPFVDDYRFRDQIRASAGSIMDNIAEGFERGGNKEFMQFLSVAKGSCGEMRSQCYRAFDFQYIDFGQLNQLLEKTLQINRQISGLMSYLRKSELKGQKYK